MMRVGEKGKCKEGLVVANHVRVREKILRLNLDKWARTIR